MVRNEAVSVKPKNFSAAGKPHSLECTSFSRKKNCASSREDGASSREVGASKSFEHTSRKHGRSDPIIPIQRSIADRFADVGAADAVAAFEVGDRAGDF